MATAKSNEKWKDVSFGRSVTNDYRLQVSDKGNLRAYNKFSDGEPLKGSTINGYGIIRLKLYEPKDKKIHAGLTSKHAAVVALRDKIKAWTKEDPKKNKAQIAESKGKLKKMQDVLRTERQMDIKARTIHYHSLVHRLVAEAFLKAKSPKHTVVGHLDYEKMNNAASNLRWMTPEENFKHQQSSPHVMKEKKERITKYRDTPRGAKLSADKVSQLKKGLAAGTPIKALAKKFNITDTQIRRIQSGTNWGHVKAAK